MKITRIKNAYIKNKPNYNYQILDLDGNYIAKGHLLNSRLKLKIMKHIQYLMNEDGLFQPKIEGYFDFAMAWILNSIDLWILGLVNRLVIENIEDDVLLWFVLQIQKKNNESILAVELNEKN